MVAVKDGSRFFKCTGSIFWALSSMNKDTEIKTDAVYIFQTVELVLKNKEN